MVSDRTGLLIDMQCVGDPRILDPRMMRQIFYIYREALHNIEKHANARNIDVAIYWSEKSVTLEIKDDGCGFDLAKIPSNHYGIRFMRERTQNLKGEFSLQSEIGFGTCITIQLPTE
jgi:signal transduction histidine kinase